MGYYHNPLSLSEKSSRIITQDYKCSVWILMLSLFALGPIIEHGVFCHEEKIMTASASSSKYPNAMVKGRAATRNFKMLWVNEGAGLGYSPVLCLRDSHSTRLELHFSASIQTKGDFLLPSLHQLSVLPRTIYSLPWTWVCSLVLKIHREKKLSRIAKFNVSVSLQAPLKPKPAESWKVSLRNYHHIFALFSYLLF